MKFTIDIQCVSPLFLHGADMNAVEIRIPSIRGQLRDWFRMLGGTPDAEQSLFGGLHGGNKRNEPVASRIVLRTDTSVLGGRSDGIATLPHKRGGPSAVKQAIENARFQLSVSTRLKQLSESEESAFLRCFKAWLLLGGLGQRVTRGGGGLSWSRWGYFEFPSDMEAYRRAIADVISSTPIRADVLAARSFETETAARRVITDTLGGPFPDPGDNPSDLANLRHPLGRVFQHDRKTSTLKLTIRKIGGRFYIVAVWDGRTAVTGNDPEDLSGIIDLLCQRNKPLGLLLRESSLY